MFAQNYLSRAQYRRFMEFKDLPTINAEQLAYILGRGKNVNRIVADFGRLFGEYKRRGLINILYDLEKLYE